ncbi:B3/B4 domain-containing protein [Marinisporobacter balticus]|uniref:DNA/RNA-binding domain of Phe-tRNA-synthetase-like protein n=1 Tax=Marinisporobacter balticus TaxID=2018667 RepID=A0A4R2K7C5_9FIRM|nr:B3/4 domain-containing protein [Marinisporobacter balticus]TCO69243.1 DNA/RNA-binding domain of Phe-tRNA-synthetase-like protein [Marinisporobacter balticus]
MKNFMIEDDFWEVFPDTKIGIILCKNIDNTIKDNELYKNMLANAEKELAKHLKEEEFSNNRVIKVWRDAFQKFKTKKGARSSIEALLKRVYNGKHIGTINPLVDMYNSISLKYALPCGGEDIDTFVGHVRLTKAVGDEPFVTLGTDENAPPYEGEIVYKDAVGAICRCWNWRESVRTMLTEETQNAFLCIELVDDQRIEEFHKALNELAKNVEEHLGGTYQIFVLDRDHRMIKIGE